MSFFAELKRRNVFRVGIGYAVTSWLLIQVTDILFESIGAPPWVMQTMFVALAAGLVIALFFAWAFELTAEGVKKENDVDRSESISPQTGQKLNLGIVALLLRGDSVPEQALDALTTIRRVGQPGSGHAYTGSGLRVVEPQQQMSRLHPFALGNLECHDGPCYLGRERGHPRAL